MVMMKDGIVYLPLQTRLSYDVCICTDSREIARKYGEMPDWMEEEEVRRDIKFSYLSLGMGKIIVKELEAPKIEINLEENYNSDLPVQEISKFIMDTKPGLMILNGELGTGKSSFIKYLIMKYKEKEWVLIPSKILLQLDGISEFVRYFSGSKNIVKNY